jgi:tRNA modification GTPase
VIVRASGERAFAIARQLGGEVVPREPRRCRLTLANGLAFPAWVWAFAGPHSHTGQAVVELHLPGNPLLARLVLDECVRLGARQAGPGEFTARAYFNGRIDLAEAEAVQATISAGSDRELAAARRLMSGELARRLDPPMNELAEALALVEVGIDFVDEDVTFISPPELRERVTRVDDALRELLATSARFERLTHEPRVVLVGKPNAGKSTLLNALAGEERAVVSPVAGTTRDALSAKVALSSGIVTVIDVAGIDRTASGDLIGSQMLEVALRTARDADVVVHVIDGADAAPLVELPVAATLVVRTKADLLNAARASSRTPGLLRGTGSESDASPGAERRSRHNASGSDAGTSHDFGHPPWAVSPLAVSAVTGWGMDNLRRALNVACFSTDDAAQGDRLALSARHVQAVESARAAIGRLLPVLAAAPAEVIAMELREALDALGSVLGVVSPDDLLGRIFAKFCIGK